MKTKSAEVKPTRDACTDGHGAAEVDMQRGCIQTTFEVTEYDTLVMRHRDFDAFAEAVERPPKPKVALRKLMARN